MQDFVKESCCKGVQPKNVITNTLFTRPRLVSELLANRDKVRLLIAPPKYGKKYVCAEYAHTVFGFKNTIWIDCASPLFLRDLDNGEFLESFKKQISCTSLVVFADTPSFNSERSDLFLSLVKRLAKSRIEVVITSQSAILEDLFKSEEIYVLSAYDLLVDESEVTNSKVNPDISDINSYELPIRLTPARVWEIGFRNVKIEKLDRDPGNEELAVKFLIYTLVHADTSVLKNLLLNVEIERVLQKIKVHEPHFIVDGTLSHAFCEREPLDDIESVFLTFLNCGLKNFIGGEQSDFYKRIAEALFDQDDVERALDVVAKFLKSSDALRWVSEKLETIMETGHCAEALVMLSKVRVSSVEDHFNKLFLEFMLYQHSKQFDSCVPLARRLLKCPSTPANMQMLTRSYLSLMCEKLETFEEVRALCTLHSTSLSKIEKSANLTNFFTSKRVVAIAELVEVVHDDIFKALVMVAGRCERIGDLKSHGISDVVFELYLVAVLFDFAASKTGGLSQVKSISRMLSSKCCTSVEASLIVSELCSFVFETSADLERKGKLGIYSINACKTCLEINELLPKKYRAKCHDNLLHRVSSYANVQRQDSKRVNYYVAKMYPESCAARDPEVLRFEGSENVVLSSSVIGPCMELKLFGNLSLSIAGSKVDDELNRRKKCMLILSVLALNRGKIMSRDEIIRAVWDDSCLGKKGITNSFYTCVSVINSVIMKVAGKKYINKERFGYRIEPSSLTSDYEKVKEICGSLFYGEFSHFEWSSIIETLREHCREPLLSQIHNNEFINNFRLGFQNSLTDSLIAGSDHLLSHGEYRGCGEFAKEALYHDNSREDAYRNLIIAQSALHQRSAAIKTYFACKKNMNEILGLDPSSQIDEAYKAVLNS